MPHASLIFLFVLNLILEGASRSDLLAKNKEKIFLRFLQSSLLNSQILSHRTPASLQHHHLPPLSLINHVMVNRGMRVLRSLEVWKLGIVNYLDALKLQEKLVVDRKSHRRCDTLLSLQHPPTYTVGKRRTDHNLLIPQSELERIGAELHYTQRGGDITFHGPHQAIIYPIISLRDIGLGARSYVEKLELTMIELAALYGVKACPGQSGETGVWVEERKIGAIGVRISNGITSHGLAFNINPDLTYFGHIVPCGITDKEVTSLRRETGFVLPHEEIIQEQLVSCFARNFGYSSLIWKEGTSIFSDKDETK